MFTAPSILTARNSTYPFIDPSRHASRLRGKTALITGAGRGIGRETALAFAAAGAKVICVAGRQEQIDGIAREINSRYQPSGESVEVAVGISADVAKPEAADGVVNEIHRRWGQESSIDILVVNAGLTQFNTVENEDEQLEGWWHVLEVNLRGTVSFIQAVLPGMRARGSGTVISLASTSGSQDIAFNTAYACSKAAVIKFNRDLGVELEGSGVFCFAMHPGTVESTLANAAGAVNMEEVQRNKKM